MAQEDANHFNLKAVDFQVTVYVPMSKGVPQISHIATYDIHRWEDHFISLRNTAHHDTYQRDYDRCRATIKWSYTCNASLKKFIHVTHHSAYDEDFVEFRFAFTNLENLSEFVNNLSVNVSGAMM